MNAIKRRYPLFMWKIALPTVDPGKQTNKNGLRLLNVTGYRMIYIL